MADDKFNIDDDDEGGGEWLNTYADLVTLLLCFFVLLYSMSTIDNKKFKQVIAAFNSMGIMGQSGSINPESSAGDSMSNLDIYNAIDVQQEQEMNDIYKKVKELIDKKGLSQDVQVEQVDEGVLLRFKDKVLFDSGEAVLKSDSISTLEKLADILREHNNTILIEGHTDNVPISNSKFKDNWELSTERAISVVRYFTQELPADKRLDPKKFEIMGFGEHKPIAPNDNAQNRQKNRRIEVTIKNKKAS
jgi:chemotaxis protein MotB